MKECTNNPLKIYRHGEPSKMDTAPHGTECWVYTTNEPEFYSVYQQASSNEESPNWIFIGIRQGNDII